MGLAEQDTNARVRRQVEEGVGSALDDLKRVLE
jgi:hypothetical protein